jgi:cell division protein ZipA
MKNIFWVIGGIIIATAVYYYFYSLKKSSKPIVYGQDGQDYSISTESQSDDRVKNLGMDKPSENASYILDIKMLSFPKDKKRNPDQNFTPDPELDYIVNLEPTDGSTLDLGYLSQLFDLNWRQKYSSTIYGHSIKDNRWTFAFSSDSPASFDKIQVAVNLLNTFGVDKNYNPQKLNRYYDELLKRISDKKIKVIKKESVAAAIDKAKILVDIHDLFDKEANIVLKSNSTFDGLKAWDALLCVGLKWGDGDLFHWNNKSDYGSDDFFGVGTSTEPTYFLPEDVKAGKMNPADLIFGFSIPRNADPIGVYKAMTKAVHYSQKKLGGVILNQSGQAFDENIELKKVTKLVEAMKAKGIEPGSDHALQIF